MDDNCGWWWFDLTLSQILPSVDCCHFGDNNWKFQCFNTHKMQKLWFPWRFRVRPTSKSFYFDKAFCLSSKLNDLDIRPGSNQFAAQYCYWTWDFAQNIYVFHAALALNNILCTTMHAKCKHCWEIISNA